MNASLLLHVILLPNASMLKGHILASVVWDTQVMVLQIVQVCITTIHLLKGACQPLYISLQSSSEIM